MSSRCQQGAESVTLQVRAVRLQKVEPLGACDVFSDIFSINADAVAGDRKRRDIVVAMKYIQFLDVYISVSQKGAISTWSNKVRSKIV